METLLKAALKHQFEFLILGTVDKFEAAHKFYAKHGFTLVKQKDLPSGFEKNPLDNLFFRRKVAQTNFNSARFPREKPEA